MVTILSRDPLNGYALCLFSQDSQAAVGATKGGGFSMRTTQQFSITLPNEMTELVRSKVAASEYATESEVIRDGLRTLAARDKAIEDWLRDQVVPAAVALDADPLRGIPIDQVRKHLTSKRVARTDRSPT
jgi:antitoxin ParD1/3/4